MVGRAKQVQSSVCRRGLRLNHVNLLRSGQHLDRAAVIGLQKVAAAQDGATWKKQADFIPALIQLGAQATLAAIGIGQCQAARAGSGHTFSECIDAQHQNRK